MPGRHDNKIAVITGAAAGIGQAYAKRLASEGATVVLVDRENAGETLKLIGGDRKQSVRCDLADPADIGRMAETVLGAFGRCDILVNNAGIYPVQKFEDIAYEDWRRIMAVNLDAQFLTVKAFAPGMRQRRWGRIVNQASDVFALVLTGFVHYTASKGGVIGLTRALASEFGNDGVTVNAIAPGLIRTPGTAGRKDAPGGLQGDIDEFSIAASHQAIKRPLTVDDLCGTLSFLASDDAAMVTGQTFYVNGGHVRT